MAAPPPGRPKGLTDRDVSYLKLLKTLKGAGEASGGGDLGVVRRIAAWNDSLPVLNFICVNQRWFDDWEVKEALLHNELTPARHRAELEKAIAIFDLLREMDAPGTSPEERAEVQEDLRYLFKQLPEHDRAVVKGRAYELSTSRRPKPETPDGAAPAATGETPREEPKAEAPRGRSLLAGEFDEFVPASAESTDGSVTEQIRLADRGEVVGPIESAASVAWDRAAEADAEADAAWLAREAAQAEADLATEEAAREQAARGVAEREQAARAAALPAATPTAPTAPPAPTASVAAAPVEVAGPIAASHADDDPDLDVDFDEEAPAAGRDVAGLPVPQRVALASSSTDQSVLSVLAYDASQDVQLALVGNPALTDRQAGTLARRATAKVAEEIYRERRLFMKPIVREGFLQCPNAPSAALLEIVNSIAELPQLLRLTKSPKIRHMEVKAKARARLAMRFKALGTGEKLAVIRRGGSALLKELWSDFFRDEALVVACISQGQLDSGTVLEIARSRIAPRRALELIGTSAAWTANYQIRLELVLNPKTPRQVVTKLIPKLTPADRAMVKKNPALPESIRQFA